MLQSESAGDRQVQKQYACNAAHGSCATSGHYFWHNATIIRPETPLIKRLRLLRLLVSYMPLAGSVPRSRGRDRRDIARPLLAVTESCAKTAVSRMRKTITALVAALGTTDALQLTRRQLAGAAAVFAPTVARADVPVDPFNSMCLGFGCNSPQGVDSPGAPGLSTPCGELQPKPKHMLLNGSTGTSARATVGANTAAAPASWRRVSCSASVVPRAATRAVIVLRILDTAVFAQLSVTASSGRAMSRRSLPLDRGTEPASGM